jgi:hypothetical protein
MLFHLIDISKCSKAYDEHVNRAAIIFERPTPWSTFLAAVFLLNRNIKFIATTHKAVKDFHHWRKAFLFLDDAAMINGDVYDVEPWTFGNLCHFCLQGLQTGTFQRIRGWRW